MTEGRKPVPGLRKWSRSVRGAGVLQGKGSQGGRLDSLARRPRGSREGPRGLHSARGKRPRARRGGRDGSDHALLRARRWRGKVRLTPSPTLEQAKKSNLPEPRGVPRTPRCGASAPGPEAARRSSDSWLSRLNRDLNRAPCPIRPCLL